ncbi:MFS transporter [Campylobacter sp. RM13119]|uniref:MFS transporter n=1 Tax=Campylobacter californiensis TaxID=1032243 RepID=UPI001473DB41|nr:MFS transporter [Campylobacter sp. RM13119]MBE3605925.1 MFS transporter [Campylobacter sp. RM13119]
MTNNKIYKYLISFGHFCSDVNQGALSAILPFLIATYNYDYTTAAMLVLYANIIGSFVQPFIGYINDKKNTPYIVLIGLILAGGGMSCVGFSSNFYLLCFAVTISGIGMAMFHPQAAKIINQASNDNNRAINISIFSFGGNLGFTLGPVFVSLVVYLFGLRGMIWFLLPQVIFAMLFIYHYKGISELETYIKTKKIVQKESKDDWSVFGYLCVVIMSRSIVFHGINTFLALFFISKFGNSASSASVILSTYYAIVAAGTLLGGVLADRYGYHTVIKSAFTFLLFSIFLFAINDNFYMALAMIIPLGAAMGMSYSPMVVLAQSYLPNHIGLASGVTLGLAVSIGGITAPFFGKIADTYTITYTFYAISLVCVVSALFSFLLPKLKVA